MQQQQQQHTPGGLPPGMIHPASHSPLQLQPPGPTQPHVPGLYVGSSVAHKSPQPHFLVLSVHLPFSLKILSILEMKIVLSIQCHVL